MATAKVGPAGYPPRGGPVGPDGGLVGPGSDTPPGDTDADAITASGTGTAYNVTATIQATIGVASGTGSAYNANAYIDEGTDALVTLVADEVIYTTTPDAIATLAAAEVIYHSQADLIATLAAAEVIYHSQADLIVTLAAVEVIYLPAPLTDTGDAWIIG